MKSRSEEIFYEDLRIRQAAISEKRRNTPHEKRRLRELAGESATLRAIADAAIEKVAGDFSRAGTPSTGPAPRDPATLPASMRPGARGND